MASTSDSDNSSNEYNLDETSTFPSAAEIDAIDEKTQEKMFSLALDPKYETYSDHDSDFEVVSEKSYEYDTEPDENEIEESESIELEICKCNTCPENSVGYCCRKVEIVCEIIGKEDGNIECITCSNKFVHCILNKDVLELIAYSIDKLKLFGRDTEAKNKLLRYTSYRCFLSLLELHGLGKSNRYKLPACVILAIQNKYPSPTGKYTGFKAGECSE